MTETPHLLLEFAAALVTALLVMLPIAGRRYSSHPVGRAIIIVVKIGSFGNLLALSALNAVTDRAGLVSNLIGMVIAVAAGRRFYAWLFPRRG